MFGKIPLPKWTAENPTYNLDLKEIFYYTVLIGIKTFTPNYYINYVRKEAEEIIKKELDWVYPGAHYFDDLYHSFIAYVHRVKFHINLNINSGSDSSGILTQPVVAHCENQTTLETLSDYNIGN